MSPRREPAPRALWLVVAAALCVRLGMLAFVGDPTGFHQAERAPRGVTWDWGYEQGAIAQALAEGRGFADPFRQGTGPTGWCAPLYPAALALLLRATGGVTLAAATALAVLQALAAALVVVPLWRLGTAVRSRALGWTAAGLWTLHPMAAYLPIALVWDSTFVALGMTWFLARVAEDGPGATQGRVARHGAALGLVALINPAPLALVPAVLLYWSRGRRAAAAAGTWGAFFGALALITAPWALRNAWTLGSPSLRTNLGVELFVGNNDGAYGPFNGRIHPAYDPAELARYRAQGEVAYAADAGARARDWIGAHPARFARLCLERVQRFWFGPRPWEPIRLGSGASRARDWQGWIEWLAHAAAGALALFGAARLRGRPGAMVLVAGPLVLFPLVYYVTHVFERYRFPLEPVVTLAAASAVLAIAQWREPARGVA